MTVLQIRHKPKPETRVFIEELYENKAEQNQHISGGLSGLRKIIKRS